MTPKKRICLGCHREIMWRESGMGRKIRCNDCVKVYRKEYKKECDIIIQLSGLGFSSSFVALYKMSLDCIS